MNIDWLFKRTHLVLSFIAIGILFGLICTMAAIEIKDYDLWLHLASGKYILEHQMIPIHGYFIWGPVVILIWKERRIMSRSISCE